MVYLYIWKCFYNSNSYRFLLFCFYNDKHFFQNIMLWRLHFLSINLHLFNVFNFSETLYYNPYNKINISHSRTFFLKYTNAFLCFFFGVRMVRLILSKLHLIDVYVRKEAFKRYMMKYTIDIYLKNSVFAADV